MRVGPLARSGRIQIAFPVEGIECLPQVGVQPRLYR